METREERAVVVVPAMKSLAETLILLLLTSCRLFYAYNVTFATGYLKIIDCISATPRQAAYIPIGLCIHDSTSLSVKDGSALQGIDIKSVKYMYVLSGT